MTRAIPFAAVVLVASSSACNHDTAAPDRDHDGVPDAQDVFPDDPNESVDTDGDGIGDNTDPDARV